MNKPVSKTPKLGTPAPITAVDHVKGPADAKVTIIEYSDFQCPACQAYYPVMEKLFAEASTTVRFVYRHYPLPQHQNAMITAQATEAAGLQGKFWEMYSLVFANHADWTETKDPRVVMLGYAKKLGLDIEKFKADIDSDAVKKLVVDKKAEGEKLGISYTPTFFVNGKVIENPQGYELFKKVIQSAVTGDKN